MGEAGVYSAPVVFNLALISGVSSSLGSVRGSAEAIARIFNNPEEYIESFRNIVELLENLGMLDQVVDQMVGSFQQRMETNNPFSETGKVTKELLYQTFRGGWYAGYVIGEVMKLALTVGALKAAKGTAMYTKVATVVKSTTAGRLAMLVNGKIDVAQFRVASTLAAGSVTIGKATLRGAKTVGSAVRVYSRSLQLDFDARELSAVQQANLRRHLIGDDDAVVRLNAMSDEERRQLLSLGTCSRTFSAGLTMLNKGCDGDSGYGFQKLRYSDSDTVYRIASLHHEGEISSGEVEQIENGLQQGDLSIQEVRRVSKVVAEEDGFLFDSRLQLSNVLELREKATLSNIEAVVRDGNGRIRWLEANSRSAGMSKISREHGQDFFRAYDSITTVDDIREVIYKVIRQSDSEMVITKPNDGGGIVYLMKIEDDAPPIRVAVSDNGFILNAFPDSTSESLFK